MDEMQVFEYQLVAGTPIRVRARSSDQALQRLTSAMMFGGAPWVDPEWTISPTPPKVLPDGTNFDINATL